MIEDAIQSDDWPTARRLIRAALRREPDSHWLLTRLGLTYYEERDYERALVYSQQAFQLAPHCPLVLWDLAGTYEMLGRLTEAHRIYRQLVSRGIPAIATGICGEGVARARSLVADSWYRSLTSSLLAAGAVGQMLLSTDISHFAARMPFYLSDLSSSPRAASGFSHHMQMTTAATPNHALQRTAPRVTLADADHPAAFAHPAPAAFPQPARRAPQSLSLGSFGDSRTSPVE